MPLETPKGAPVSAAATTKGSESPVGPVSHLPDFSLDASRTSFEMAPDACVKAMKLSPNKY